MSDDLIKIYNKFGFESQLSKLIEEFYETSSAFDDYKISYYMGTETEDQFIQYIKELFDQVTVAKQIAIVKYGKTSDEIEALSNSGVSRTIKIIDIMNKTGETYDEVRERVR